MENTSVKLCIDRYSQNDSDFEKWAAFVEKYVQFCLKQKEVAVELVSAKETTDVSDEHILIYVPVFSEKTLLEAAYMERINHYYSKRQSKNLLLLGLIKDSAVTEKVYSLYPDLKLHKMYLVDSDTGHDVSDKNLWKKETLDQFLFKIYDVCNEAERGVKVSAEKDALTVKKAVYIAEASPDVMPVRDEIRRELIKMGFEVYPSKQLSGTTKEMEKTIGEYLQKSLLSVHLMGKLPQEAKAGEISRVELENKVAANFYTTKIETKKHKSPFTRIIWLPDNLVVLDEVQSKFLREVQRDKKLYAGADIIQSSIEELKDIILEKLEGPKEEKKAARTPVEPSQTVVEVTPKREGIAAKVVYVINSEKNREGATAVKKILENIGCEVLAGEGNEERETEDLKKCNSVLFYYINEDPGWLRNKMSEVVKAKSSESVNFLKRGIISFENQELPADDIFKEVVHIKAGQQLEADQLLSFFEKAF